MAIKKNKEIAQQYKWWSKEQRISAVIVKAIKKQRNSAVIVKATKNKA